MTKKDLLKLASKDEVKRVELKFNFRRDSDNEFTTESSKTKIQLLGGEIKIIERKGKNFTLLS